MVRKLRVTALVCGGFLILAAAWGSAEYPAASAESFIWIGFLGIVVAITPVSVAKLRLYYARARTEIAGGSRTNDHYFISVSTVDSHERTLQQIRDVVVSGSDFDSVTETDFPEGSGLRITHTGFHNSFVRVNGNGYVVVSGASTRTEELADVVTETLGVDFDRRWSNPMQRGRPITGGYRVVLATIFLITAVTGGLAVADAGYPSDAYNPAEKAALAGYDAWGTVSPSVSKTDTAIAKAWFRVMALQEADKEVGWANNESRLIVGHGRDALTIAGDVRTTLNELEATPLSAAHRRQVRNIRSDLRNAEVAVADALRARADDKNLSPEGKEDIRDVADALRHHRAGTGNLSLSITLPPAIDEGRFTTIDGNTSA